MCDHPRPDSVARRIVACVCLAVVVGCDKETYEIPEEEKPAPVQIDLEHMGKFKADREISFSNMVLVWQPDAAGQGRSALSLTSERVLPDGSRVIFGTYANAASLKQLSESKPDFAGSARFDVRSNGVFTPLATYQPKLARLELSEFGDQRVSGTIRGEFYSFRTMQPTAKPTVIEGEFTFRARLVDRSGGSASAP